MTSNGATNKPFSIEKRRVYEAYKAVKSNRGAAGVDGQTLEMFEGRQGGVPPGGGVAASLLGSALLRCTVFVRD